MALRKSKKCFLFRFRSVEEQYVTKINCYLFIIIIVLDCLEFSFLWNSFVSEGFMATATNK